MKNILLWAGIGLLVFKDQLFPKKTTRQQQFLQTGETTQAFIGEVNDEFILLLKKLFKVKLLPKSSPAYNLVNDSYYFETKIYIVNKGIKDGFVLFVDYHNDGKIGYQIFFATGDKIEYSRYYEDFERTEEEEILFGDSVVRSEIGNELEMMYEIWNSYIRFYKKEISKTLEGKNALEFFESGNRDMELGFYLLSNVPNIKKILSK